jgi:gamma-glutamyltranspeptidase/glutathione hydrolase
MRVAFVDRARHLGDPDFVDVPVAKLLAAERLRSESAKIPADRARSSASLGRDLLAPPDEGDETTHFSVIDAQGLAVANTYTLEAGWGGSLVVEGAGFLLNNEMGDFNRKPGHTDRKGNIGTTPNVIAPGKRMLSSMTPTIVRKDGKVVLVTGSPGGRTIINTVVRVVLGALEFDLGGRAAVDAPRIHHQWLPDRLQVEEGRFSEATLAALRALGHRVLEKDEQGDAHTIMVDPKSGVATGIADRRRSDDAGVATGE